MEIEWTEPAVKDLDAIYAYISTDSEFYASSFVEKIIEAVGKLKDFPEIGRIVSEADNPNVRELIFQNFRIIYRIINENVQILTVIRGSRDMSSLKSKPWEIT